VDEWKNMYEDLIEDFRNLKLNSTVEKNEEVREVKAGKGKSGHHSKVRKVTEGYLICITVCLKAVTQEFYYCADVLQAGLLLINSSTALVVYKDYSLQCVASLCPRIDFASSKQNCMRTELFYSWLSPGTSSC